MVSDLKRELESLQIDRGRPGRRRRLWQPVLVIVMVLAGAAAYVLRARQAMAGVLVETVRASLASMPGVSAGTAILAASGYVVPRRKAVVSAKIQGRLAELRVEEGSRVKEGEVLARLDGADYLAQVEKSRASVERAQAALS